MNETDKPIIGTGSLLNSSEGIITAGALAALTTALTSSADWRVSFWRVGRSTRSAQEFPPTSIAEIQFPERLGKVLLTMLRIQY